MNSIFPITIAKKNLFRIVLPANGNFLYKELAPIVKHNLNWPQREKDGIISQLLSISWSKKTSYIEYQRVTLVLEEEER